ncbi:MAG: glycosyltransferase family 39 protein [Chitinophagaceae bacterium]|nr:glycosyltransferase family 39 protein [Chitinophagaceae bacterium]
MPAIQLSRSSFLFLLALVTCLNFTGLFNEIMEPDGTIYAALAKEIAKSGNWLFLWVNGADWLDKPHLPFWMAATSFKIFGYNAFAYKLPSFILFVVSLFYCYRLACVIYSKETARLATLIYGSALHIIISNFDGKVEIYLTAFVVAAMYHMYRAFESTWFRHIVAAALFAACAAMTKGIFVLITIAVGFVIYWIRTKQWQEFIKLKWYVFVLLVFIFILPELYALYLQFDLHPEKVVYGKTDVSGLRFFFWDSQFGRFFNNGPITGKGDLSFFLHTTLWAFIPWSILLLLAVINFFRKKKNTEPALQRWIIGGSALFSFMMFTFSKFQLPHYIVILFPHFSMITAAYLLEGTSEKAMNRINIFQTVLFVLVFAAVMGIIIIYAFDSALWFFIVAGLIVVATLFYKTQNTLLAVLKKNIGLALLVAVFINCLFYPSLLKYQAGMMAGKWLNLQPAQPTVTLYKCLSTSFDFYYNGKTDYSNPDSTVINNIASNDSLYLFGAVQDLKDMNTDSVTLTPLKTFPYFHVSQVNGKFINHKTRQNVLDTFAITLVTRKDHSK